MDFVFENKDTAKPWVSIPRMDDTGGPFIVHMPSGHRETLPNFLTLFEQTWASIQDGKYADSWAASPWRDFKLTDVWKTFFDTDGHVIPELLFYKRGLIPKMEIVVDMITPVWRDDTKQELSSLKQQVLSGLLYYDFLTQSIKMRVALRNSGWDNELTEIYLQTIAFLKQKAGAQN